MARGHRFYVIFPATDGDMCVTMAIFLKGAKLIGLRNSRVLVLQKKEKRKQKPLHPYHFNMEYSVHKA